MRLIEENICALLLSPAPQPTVQSVSTKMLMPILHITASQILCLLTILVLGFGKLPG